MFSKKSTSGTGKKGTGTSGTLQFYVRDKIRICWGKRNGFLFLLESLWVLRSGDGRCENLSEVHILTKTRTWWIFNLTLRFYLSVTLYYSLNRGSRFFFTPTTVTECNFRVFATRQCTPWESGKNALRSINSIDNGKGSTSLLPPPDLYGNSIR